MCPSTPHRDSTLRGCALAIGIALAVGLVLPAFDAKAADAAGEFRVFGSGELSCHRWVEDRREGNPSAAQSEMWVAGYLTAYNQFVHKDKDVTDPYDGNFVLQWIDDYCRKRPTNQLYLAARELLSLLRRRQ